MFGLEVAGIVLGSIPFIISVLDDYSAGLQSHPAWRKYEREVRSVVRGLSTEQHVLINTYETLLQDILPDSEIDGLVKTPFGPAWGSERLRQRLQARLHRDYDVFLATVNDMMDVVEEVKAKLDLGPEGVNAWMRSRQGGAQRVAFTVNRAQYHPLIERLQNGNTTLWRLVRHNMDLEPRSRIESPTRFLELAQRSSGNMYRALRGSISCECDPSHGLNLELSMPQVRGGHSLGNDEIIFRVGLSTAPSRKTLNQAHLLQRLLIQPYQPESTLRSRSNKNHRSSREHKEPQSDQISITTDPSIRALDAVQPLEISTALEASLSRGSSQQARLPLITDLCSTVRAAEQAHNYPSCYGYIATPPSASPASRGSRSGSSRRIARYAIYPAPSAPQHPAGGGGDDSNCSLVSLHSLLNYERGALATLGYTRHVRLAHALACAILQHHGTPWLPRKPTSRDIVLLRRDGAIDWDHVFLAHTPGSDSNSPAAAGTAKPTTTTTSSGEPPKDDDDDDDDDNARHAATDAILEAHRTTLLGLGIILLELLLRRPIDALRRTVRHAPPPPPRGGSAAAASSSASSPAHLDALRSLAARVDATFGRALGSAVARCVGFALDPDLGVDRNRGGAAGAGGDVADADGRFRREFYATVVAPLEEAVGRAAQQSVDGATATASA